MTLGLLALLVLAAFRVTRLVTRDTILDGPRDALLRRWTTGKAEDWRAELIVCAWCVGFWLSGIIVVAADAAGSVPLPGLVWLATSGGVGLLAKID